MDADSQRKSLLGDLRQYGATVLHLARAEQRRISRIKGHDQSILGSFVYPPPVSGGDPFEPIQAPFKGMPGLGVIELCGG